MKTIEERLDRIERNLGIKETTEWSLFSTPGKFKVGDKVRVFANPYSSAPRDYLAAGTLHEITTVHPGGDVSLKGHETENWFSSRFELVEEPKPQFKKGDRVRVKVGKGGYRPYLADGTINVVDRVDVIGGSFYLRLEVDPAEGWDVARFEFAPVEEPKAVSRPLVRVLGWPGSDGNFTLCLVPVKKDGTDNDSANKDSVEFAVVLRPLGGAENLGIENLSKWYAETKK